MQDDVYRARSDKSQFVSLNTPVVYNNYAPIRWIVRNKVVEMSTCFNWCGYSAGQTEIELW